MTRRGSSLLVVIIVLGISLMLLMGDIAGHARRLADSGARARRLAARELAMGAAALQPGASVRVGTWTVSRGSGDDAQRLAAEGPTGVYVIDHGRDRWSPAEGGSRSGAPAAVRVFGASHGGSHGDSLDN